MKGKRLEEIEEPKEEGQGVVQVYARKAWLLFMRFLKATAEVQKKRSRVSEGGVEEVQGGGGGEEQGAERVTFDKEGRERLFAQLDKMEAELKQGLHDLQEKLDAI